MAEIKVSCSQCGQHFQCDESYGGKQINCPHCQTALVVPQMLQARPTLQVAQHQEKTYLVTSKGNQCGPYTVEELKTYLEAGQLAWEDFAWCEGMSNWQPLRGIIAPKGIASTPPPLPSARGQYSTNRYSKPEGNAWVLMTLWLLFLPAAWWYRSSRSWSEESKPKQRLAALVGFLIFLLIAAAIGLMFPGR